MTENDGQLQCDRESSVFFFFFRNPVYGWKPGETETHDIVFPLLFHCDNGVLRSAALFPSCLMLSILLALLAIQHQLSLFVVCGFHVIRQGRSTTMRVVSN